MNSFLARRADNGQATRACGTVRKGAQMSLKPPTRAMRENPDIDQLKRQAKELLEAYRKQQPEAVAEVNFYHRTAAPETLALHDAQFVRALLRLRKLAQAQRRRRRRHLH
jgi:hypothetical protein